MGQWERAREVLLSASQERGGGRGGQLEAAMDSVLVSVPTFTTDCRDHDTDFGDKFPKSTAPALFNISMFVVCISAIAILDVLTKIER